MKELLNAKNKKTEAIGNNPTISRYNESHDYEIDEALHNFVDDLVNHNGIDEASCNTQTMRDEIIKESSEQTPTRRVHHSPVKNYNSKLLLYGTKKGRFQLLPDNFSFPTLTLSSFVTAWYCGNSVKGIPPYKVLRSWDVTNGKCDKQKLSQMRKLMCYVEKGAVLVNQPLLVKSRMTEREARLLYMGVKHLFRFPAGETKTRRYETMSWKSYYNLLCKRGWRLYGEKGGESKADNEQQKKRSQQQRTRRATSASREKEGDQRQKSTQQKQTPTQRKQTPTQRKQKQTPTQQKRVLQLPAPNAEFLKAFASIPEATDEQEEHIKKMEMCSVGCECKNTHLSGRMHCHAPGCDNRIHHLCAITRGWLDSNNELNVYCSSHCMP